LSKKTVAANVSSNNDYIIVGENILEAEIKIVEGTKVSVTSWMGFKNI